MQITVEKGYPMIQGVSLIQDGINFAIAVPQQKQCSLIIYLKSTGEKLFEISLTNQHAVGDIRCVLLKGFSISDCVYMYQMDGKEIIDPYAAQVMVKQEKQNEKNTAKCVYRCGFPCFDYDWEQDKNPEVPLHDVIVYRMHLKGFTKHHSSEVKARGTFLGLMEKVPYIKQLGINQIEVMPIYEFDEEFHEGIVEQIGREAESERRNYWGYAQQNYYFAPKATYADSANVQEELKNLIKELHKNGIEFIMEFYFTNRIPVSLMIDCLKYWVLEYHVDGFHLTGDYIPTEEITNEPIFSKSKIYFEHLNRERFDSLQRNMETDRHLAQSTDDYLIAMRRFLKGDFNTLESAAFYLQRNENKYSYVNYFTSHNGFTLLDMVSYSEKHNEDNLEDNRDGWIDNFTWNCGIEGTTKSKKILSLRKRQMKNAWFLLLLSQGIPAILAGDELCNTQKGNNNAYCQDNAIGWLNWKIPASFSEIPEFVAQLIQFRKKHPVLHQSQHLKNMDYKGIGYPDISFHGEKAWYINFQKSSCCLGVLYCSAYSKDSDDIDYIYIAINMDWKKQNLAIPNLPKEMHWYRELDTSHEKIINDKQKLKDQRILTIEERSCVVLISN